MASCSSNMDDNDHTCRFMRLTQGYNALKRIETGNDGGSSQRLPAKNDFEHLPDGK